MGGKKPFIFSTALPKKYDRSHSEYSEYSEYSEIQRIQRFRCGLPSYFFRNATEKNERFFSPFTGITRNGR